MKHEDVIAANRATWNRSAPYHASGGEFARLLKGFSGPGFSSLDSIATGYLERIGVAGKRVAQVCCNKGHEILSIENMGAAYCVGFDQSAAFLDLARQLAAAGNLGCEFVETDAYEIPLAYDGQFDLCVITIGVFGWMPDLPGFLDRVAGLLKPGGRLFVYEEHPVMNMFEPGAVNHMLPENSYFRSEPYIEEGVIVYDASDVGDAQNGDPHYWFFHPLSSVLNGCISSGIRIDSFDEYPHNISSEEFAIFEQGSIRLPMSYVLIGTRVG